MLAVDTTAREVSDRPVGGALEWGGWRAEIERGI